MAATESFSRTVGDLGGFAFRRLTDIGGAPGTTAAVVALVRDAGNPYCDWFFGGERRARRALARWLGRHSSELASERVTLLADGDQVAGLFVAVGGAELGPCRRTDTVAALVEAGEERQALAERIAAAGRLFLPVPDDSLYLSRVAVVPRFRGRGLGRALVAEFLRAGAAAEFPRFDLDVSAENERAIRLYESFGFRVEAARHGAGMQYLRMARIDGWPD